MTNNPLGRLSVQQLKRAVSIREQVDRLESELDRLGNGQSSIAKRSASAKKGKLSAATRARISVAMKARWARIKMQKARR